MNEPLFPTNAPKQSANSSKGRHWDGSDNLPESDVFDGVVRTNKFSGLSLGEKLAYLAIRKMPVYVINRKQNPAAQLSLTFPGLNGGKSETVQIPAISLPMCLTDYVTNEQISSSRDFKELLGKNIIELVPPLQANTLLSTPDAKEIMDREMLKIKTGSAMSQMVDKNAGIIPNAPDKESPWIQNTISRHLAGELNAGDLLLDLKARAARLTKADFVFITSKIGSSAPKIKVWADEQIARIVDEEKKAGAVSVAV